MKQSKRFLRALFALLCVSLTTGCVSAIVMGGAVATTAAFDERPIGRHFDDVTIARKVDTRLIAEKDMPSRWVSIEVIEGVVTLTGYLPTQSHIDRALFICRSVEGVLRVDNQLIIGEPSASSLFTDTWITTQVKARLWKDKLVSGFSLHVETVNGKVYLQGIVEHASQRYQAMSLAKSVKGVTAVVDLLRLNNK
ncbi:MAG: BON domain-containing protein [Mariprofundaceae bacterium]|nr:BON domain-containing protein [Mariprofundaceae bacterium]